MQHCSECGTPLAANDLFCRSCGLEVPGVPTYDSSDPVMETIGGQKTIGGEHTRTGGRTSPSVDLEPGTEFTDRYVIDSVIGRGGMGVVYKAKDTLTDQTIALKLIRPERASGESAIKRLIAEGTTARDIRHKNIVAVYDVGATDGQPFVSMEFIGGPSLRAWHREKALAHEPVPVRGAARIIAEILDGLKAAHDKGVVHRDLKPENIILMGEPDAKSAPLKILDFGIANVAGGPDTGTSGGLGTIGYMAPEQKTNPSAATASADIYSVSILFYELLMDVQPTGHWQPPSSARSDVPPGIDSLIETGLSNRPASRPQSAAAYRKTLVNAINTGLSLIHI